MPSAQENLYQVSRIIEIVADDLYSFVGRSEPLQLFEALDLSGRLDFVVEVIRQANGAYD